MRLGRDLKRKRNELIGEVHRANPGQSYVWAVEEGCRILRETIAEATTRTASPVLELTAADFAAMPAAELAARILGAPR